MRGLFKPAFYEDIENSYLIDVRPQAVFNRETIQGAVNIPISEIRSRFNEIPKDRKVLLFCNTGHTSYVASRILEQEGFNNIYSLAGGIELYKEIAKEKQENVIKM